MTEKKHCDVCDQVIDAERTPVATIELSDGTKMAIEVDAVPAHRGNVHVCLYCALTALNDKDHRPRPAPISLLSEADKEEVTRTWVRLHLVALSNHFAAWPVPDSEVADPCASDQRYAMADHDFQGLRTGTNFLSVAGAKVMLTYLFRL